MGPDMVNSDLVAIFLHPRGFVYIFNQPEGCVSTSPTTATSLLVAVMFLFVHSFYSSRSSSIIHTYLRMVLLHSRYLLKNFFFLEWVQQV